MHENFDAWMRELEMLIGKRVGPISAYDVGYTQGAKSARQWGVVTLRLQIGWLTQVCDCPQDKAKLGRLHALHDALARIQPI